MDSSGKAHLRVIIPFNTPYLYGMERTVLSIFDALRPEVEPHFVTAESFRRLNLPIIRELQRLQMPHSFVNDGDGGWPPWQKPHSFPEALRIARATLAGNAVVFKAGSRFDALCVPSPSYIFGWATGIAMRLRGCPVIYQCNDMALSPGLMRPWQPILTDCVFGTQAARALAMRNAPMVGRVRNWIIPPILNVSARATEGQVPRPGKIVYLGQISPHKGIDLLISAFARLLPDYSYAELHLIGGCAERHQNWFQESLRSSGVQDRIRVWGFQEDYQSMVASAWVYVQPSPPSRFNETHSVAVIEALALGVPVVCFRSGGLVDMVPHAKAGIVCEETSQNLTEALRLLLGNSDERDRLAEGARRQFETEFAPAVLRERWLMLLRYCTTPRRKRPAPPPTLLGS